MPKTEFKTRPAGRVIRPSASQFAVPLVKIGGKSVSAHSLSIVEAPDRTPWAQIEFNGSLPRTPESEEPFCISLATAPGGNGTSDVLFQGTVADCEKTRGPNGVSWQIRAVDRSAAIDQPISKVIKETTRTGAIRVLLGESGNLTGSIGSADDSHSQVICLNETPRRALTQLLAMGGRALVLTTDGPVSVDLSKPAADPLVIPESWPVRQRFATPVRVRAVAGTSPELPEPVTVDSGNRAAACARLVIGQAVTKAELEAAAKSTAFLARQGDFDLKGGPALISCRPGTWLNLDPDTGPSLITGRVRQWVQRREWTVELRGGFPWHAIGSAPENTTPVTVMGIDPATGLLRVTAGAYDGIELLIQPPAGTATPDRVAAFPVTAGDRGHAVIGPSGGRLISVGLPSGLVSVDDYRRHTFFVRGGNYGDCIRGDGSREILNGTFNGIFDQWKVAANRFDHNSR
jgi:hypothetical protein